MLQFLPWENEKATIDKNTPYLNGPTGPTSEISPLKIWSAELLPGEKTLNLLPF